MTKFSAKATQTKHGTQEIPQDMLRSKILVVDDAEFNQIVIREILLKRGFSNIKFAADGESALQITKQWKPDLVLLDLMLPKMNGYEYCQKIRAYPEFSDMPILVQTALTDPERRAEAFRMGASDLVTKPINAEELLARCCIQLERRYLVAGLTRYKQRVETELAAAAEMQQSILPSDEALNKFTKQYGIEVQYYFQSSSEVGGDFWGIRPINAHMAALYAVDFSGHGVTAALNAFRMHAVMDVKGAVEARPDEFLNRLNTRLCPLLHVEQFATMFYAIVDRKKQTLTYSSAGTPPPVLISESNGKFTSTILRQDALPLGVERSADYTLREAPFTPGSILAVYSDALVEERNQAGHYLSEEDIAQVLMEKAEQGASTAQLRDAVVEMFMRHSVSKKGLRDDLTVNIYRVV